MWFRSPNRRRPSGGLGAVPEILELRRVLSATTIAAALPDPHAVGDDLPSSSDDWSELQRGDSAEFASDAFADGSGQRPPNSHWSAELIESAELPDLESESGWLLALVSLKSRDSQGLGLAARPRDVNGIDAGQPLRNLPHGLPLPDRSPLSTVDTAAGHVDPVTVRDRWWQQLNTPGSAPTGREQLSFELNRLSDQDASEADRGRLDDRSDVTIPAGDSVDFDGTQPHSDGGLIDIVPFSDFEQRSDPACPAVAGPQPASQIPPAPVTELDILSEPGQATTTTARSGRPTGSAKTIDMQVRRIPVPDAVPAALPLDRLLQQRQTDQSGWPDADGEAKTEEGGYLDVVALAMHTEFLLQQGTDSPAGQFDALAALEIDGAVGQHRTFQIAGMRQPEAQEMSMKSASSTLAVTLPARAAVTGDRPAEEPARNSVAGQVAKVIPALAVASLLKSGVRRRIRHVIRYLTGNERTRVLSPKSGREESVQTS